MNVHASPAALPELHACLSAFQGRFRRPEGREALERSTTGLLTELPNKNGDTIAQAVPGPSAQRLQEFLTNMPWDEEDLNRQRVQKMITEATTGDGVLVFDDTGLPKRGTASVGVAWQYAGTLGKVGNCQVAVTCSYTDRQATWPVAVRLYLPKPWAHDAERRQQARVPTAVAFQTKPEIALALLDQARAWGVPHRGVVADADDGDNPNFLAGLEARQEPYVVAVRTDFQVRDEQALTSPAWRADDLLRTVPRWQWRTIRWRKGTKGWLRKKFVALRCWRVTSDGQRHEGWLVGERATQGRPEERKYVWSNLPPETPLDVLTGYAHRRHAIEQFHEEAKGELGWDQYQGRLWRGFHRHAVTVMLSYSFWVWLERQQWRRAKSQGRLGNPFFPLGQRPGARPFQPCIVRSPGGSATKQCCSAVVGHNGSVHRTLLR
jgi:SRSO17 transposase